MAVVRVKGRPSLFVTMTANAEWAEIKRELLPGQRAEDRPDIVGRVFNGKFKQLLKDLHKDQFFGKVAGMCWVWEWQKRGLPHGHALFVLHDDDKIHSADDYDKVVSAEIPDPETEPELHAIVARCMMHGPCGQLKPDAPCTRNGQCTKGFPKQFQEETEENMEGYPLYRRHALHSICC